MSNSVTQWIASCQAPLSMGCSREEYWSELPCPPPGDLPDPGIKPASLRSPALAGRFFTTSTKWEAPLGFESTVNESPVRCYGDKCEGPSPVCGKGQSYSTLFAQTVSGIR